MAYRIAGIDVHKKILAVVVSDVEIDGEHQFVSFDGLSGKASVAQPITGVLWIWLNVGSLREYANHVSISTGPRRLP
jgi:hypothetical protein